MAAVYRFRDSVAIHTSGGPTRYLTARDARKLAAALNRVVRSISAEPFRDSTCGTTTVPDYDATADITAPAKRNR